MNFVFLYANATKYVLAAVPRMNQMKVVYISTICILQYNPETQNNAFIAN